MKLVIFGLTLSSSWGNGHATLWRGLLKAMIRRGHDVVFFERDVPYYAENRDVRQLDNGELLFYPDFSQARRIAKRHLDEADVAIVTSYCPDGIAVSELVLESRARFKVFYDLDSPVTLDRLRRGLPVDYIGSRGLRDFDLVLSYAGGTAIQEITQRLGARRVAPLYGSVDPEVHAPAAPRAEFRGALSCLGTYSGDRLAALTALFVEPARRLASERFILGGPMYPENFPWTRNTYYFPHVAPPDHAAFYCSSPLTLNVTREPMLMTGFCPSGRIFEAAACGTPVLSDFWQGVEAFFEPGKEILVARTPEEAVESILLPKAQLARIARAARERVLESHTAEKRAAELEGLLENLVAPSHSEARGSAGQARSVWGIVPAAGVGSRIQPLAFSKELLPVGSRMDGTSERPRAISEYLLERMIQGGADRICFVISPGKSDILGYFGSSFGSADLCYVVQPRPAGLCDSIFRASHLIRPEDVVAVGLPDTIWFPENGFRALDEDQLSFLLFPVAKPELFDVVLLADEEAGSGRVREIKVKQKNPGSKWVWGAFKMPGRVYQELHQLWHSRRCQDEYFGTLVNAYLRGGGQALGIRSGKAYVDVGTLNGYREAIQVLSGGGHG